MARSKIDVVRAGMNNPPIAYRSPAEPATGRLLFIGIDFLRKGGDLVVEAVHRLRKGGDQALRLTVVGPRRWPLAGSPPDWIDYRGLLAPEEVRSLLPVHDLFVMPSTKEGFGLVFIEAAAFGRAVIAGGAGSEEAMIDGVTGFCTKNQSNYDLTGRVIELAQDDNKRITMGRAGRALVEQNFTQVRFVHQVKELIASLEV